MANRKSASKQIAGGPKPQSVDKNRSASTGNSGNASKPPTSSNQPSRSKAQTRTAPKPPQPQVAENHSPNGTKSQGTGNGAPRPQGANDLSWIFGRADATSGRKASQDRSMNQAAPKHTGNGPNNNPQKAQGHAPVLQPNKPQAPKSKHSQPLTGGHSPALNSGLSSPRPGNAQPSLFSGVHENKAGKKVLQDQSSTPKQSGHLHAHTKKAQNHAPTPQTGYFPVFQTHQQPKNLGKNTANGSPKVQTTTQHSPRGDQSVKGPESPSHNHKASSHSRFAQETSNRGPKNLPRSTIDDQSLGQINTPPPTKKVKPPPAKVSPSISAGSKGTRNRSSDSINLSAPKQSPAAAEGSGPLGWLSSLLPSAGPQATKKPMPNPSKAKGLESLPNGSQTRQIQVSNLFMLKGTDSGIANVPPKNALTPNNSFTPGNDKVRQQSRQVQEMSNKCNNNNNNNGGRSELPLIPPKKVFNRLPPITGVRLNG